MRASHLELGLDGGDAVGRRRHGLSLLIGDLDVEGLLDRHDQLDGVERVGAQVLREARARHDGVELHAQLLSDDALDLVLHLVRDHRDGREARARQLLDRARHGAGGRLEGGGEREHAGGDNEAERR